MQEILGFKNQRGFTLIEISIVTMIVGILLGSFAPIYFKRVEQARYENTQTAVASLSESIGDFRSLYGRYPCPARTDLSRDDAQYGREGDCSDATVGVGTCASGVCIEESIRQVNIGTPAAPNMVKPRVRLGMLPFRDMNLEESQIFDGYGNIVTYAVTERSANTGVIFEEANGGIDIIGEDGNSVMTPAGSAHFILISHGKNGAGRFQPDGTRAGCPAGIYETENCDDASDSVFRSAAASGADDEFFDDAVKYFTQATSTEWRMKTPDELASATEIPPIHQINLGDSVIIDGSKSTAPIVGTDIVEGTLRTSDELRTQSMCEMNGSSSCFSPALIAGAAPTGGMACPAGEFMIGIQHGAPVCDNEIFAICPEGQMLIGFNTDGSLKCQAPPKQCPATSLSICPSTTQFLPKSLDGAYVTVTAGDSRSYTYRCTGGYWSLYTYSGVCTCTVPPYSPLATTKPCGLGWIGTKTFMQEYKCPAGIWTTAPSAYWDHPDTIAKYCTCVPTEDKKEFSCEAAGYPKPYEGKVVKRRLNTCPANTWSCGTSGNWPGCEVLSDTCTCPVGKKELQQVNCKTGYTSPSGQKIWQQRFLACPSGTWGPWEEVSNDCVCVPKAETREVSCPPGKVGVKIEERKFTCTSEAGTWSGWTEIENHCTDAPVVVCKWTASVTGESGVSGIGEQLGYTCDTCGAIDKCHMRLGPGNFYNYSVCTCQ